LSLVELMEAEVTTPGKVPESIRDAPASVYLIARDDIETFGYSSLTEVLESVPGMYNIDNYTGLSGNFGVRGFWNGREQNSSLAFLINGVPQTRPDLFTHPMEEMNIPVEAIDRIEIARGPNSVIYGNGASFGVINIITNGSYDSDEVSVSYGSNDTRRFSARASSFGDDYHIIASVGIFDTAGLGYDLVEMMSPDRQALLPFYGVDLSNTSLDGRLEQQTKHYQVSAAWKMLYLELTRSDSDVESYTGFPAVEEGNIRSDTRTQVSVGVRLPVAEGYELDVRLTHLDFDRDVEFDALFPGFEGLNNLDFENWELESLLRANPSDDFGFLLGWNNQYLKDLVEFTRAPVLGVTQEWVDIQSRNTHSLFAQVNYDFSDELRFAAGYRYEEMEEFDRFVFENVPLGTDPEPKSLKGGFQHGTPRFSIIYQPEEAHVFKLLYGEAVRIPFFSSVEFSTENTRTIELDYTWVNKTYLFSASVFHNSLKDLLIDEIVIPPGGVGIVDFNLSFGGEIDTFGIELLFRDELTERLSLEAGVTWQDSDDSSTPDGLLSYSPTVVGHAKLSYRHKDVRLAALARYVDKMVPFFMGNSRSSLAFDGFFGDEVAAYAVVDLQARFENLWKNLYVQLRVNNLFDEEIRYPSNPINGLLTNRGNIGESRGFSIKSGFEF